MEIRRLANDLDNCKYALFGKLEEAQPQQQKCIRPICGEQVIQRLYPVYCGRICFKTSRKEGAIILPPPQAEASNVANQQQFPLPTCFGIP